MRCVAQIANIYAKHVCNYLVFLKDFKRIMRPRKEHVIFFELFGR